MSARPSGNVVLLEPAAAALRHDFIAWQCRIRQLAVRQFGGRPSSGMRPRALTPTGDEIAAAITVLIVETDPADSTKLFRHQYLKTQDANERYDKILELLAGSYFQTPADFSDVMTALFAAGSTTAARLLTHGHCQLEIEQYTQAYRLPCPARSLPAANAFHQATLAHNRLFNPSLPPDVRVLSFTPDWPHAASWRVETE